MQLLVGLGNPGNKYKNTRHNTGFRFVDVLAKKQGLRFAAVPRFHAETTTWEQGGRKVLLIKPQTFMNNSGECVGPLARYYGVVTADIFVIYDDLDLAAGKFRLKTGGGHGGHNGLRSLNQHLPDCDYRRLKVGIGRPPNSMPKEVDVTSWVLSKATTDDQRQEERIFTALMEELPTVLGGDLALASNHMHLHLQES